MIGSHGYVIGSELTGSGADSGFVAIWCRPLMRFRPGRPSQPLPVCVSHRKRSSSQSTRPEGLTHCRDQSNGLCRPFRPWQIRGPQTGAFDPGRGSVGPAGPESQMCFSFSPQLQLSSNDQQDIPLAPDNQRMRPTTTNLFRQDRGGARNTETQV